MSERMIKARNAIRHNLLGLFFLLCIFVLCIVNGQRIADYWIYDKMEYTLWIQGTGDSIETDYISNFWHKTDFVNFNGAIRNALGQPEMNGITKLNNGYLMTTFPRRFDSDIDARVEALCELEDYLQSKDIPMLFTLAPYTSSKYDPQLPLGIVDYGNDNMDRFVQKAKERNLSVIDFRDEMHNDGIDQYDMMYKTDHHWTSQAGFYAYTKIVAWLEQELGCVVEEKVKSFDSYTVETYPEWLLGSSGQRTGIYYTGIDDFDLIKPTFKTNLVRDGVSGTFDDLVMNTDLLATRNFSLGSPYDYVLGGSLNDFTNPNALNDQSILVVADSMGKAVNPYLILSFGETRRINPLESNKITAELIEAYDPDAVVFLYYTTVLFDESTFQFDIN